jgi:hypothetical protein
MEDKYFTSSRLNQITFANSNSRKIRKNINVKGFFRKGKFVRAFNREQDVREKVVKVAVASLAVLGGALGVGVATAALTKVRYNRNLVNFGKNIAKGGIGIEDMKIPSGVKAKNLPKIRDLSQDKVPKKSMTFFIGGMDRAENGQGDKFMRLVKTGFSKQKRGVEENHELIPLFHNYQVKRDVLIAGKQVKGIPEVEVAQEIADVFEKATVKGYNKDSVIMANEIYKWHKLNPSKPINLVTASAGGFQGREVPHILQAAGVDVKKLMKVFSTASPDYGLVDEIVPTMKVMHNDDLYSKTIPGLKDGLRLPSLHRGTRFIGKGDTPEYRDMVARKGMADMGNVVTKGDEGFIAGKRYILPKSKHMPVFVHLGPAYFNGETKTSKKTYQYLYNFMFKD